MVPPVSAKDSDPDSDLDVVGLDELEGEVKGVEPLGDVTQTRITIQGLLALGAKATTPLVPPSKGASCAKSAIAPMPLSPTETDECALVILDEDGGQTETTTTVHFREVNIDGDSDDETARGVSILIKYCRICWHDSADGVKAWKICVQLLISLLLTCLSSVLSYGAGE